jgi:uncharacterized membrane protein YbhN (UPF0104 family)
VFSIVCMFNSTNYNPQLWLCGRYFFIGNALNNILPMRYGDIYRLIEFSKKTNIPSSTVLASIAVERVFDMFALLLLFQIITLRFLTIC